MQNCPVCKSPLESAAEKPASCSVCGSVFVRDVLRQDGAVNPGARTIDDSQPTGKTAPRRPTHRRDDPIRIRISRRSSGARQAALDAGGEKSPPHHRRRRSHHRPRARRRRRPAPHHRQSRQNARFSGPASRRRWASRRNWVCRRKTAGRQLGSNARFIRAASWRNWARQRNAARGRQCRSDARFVHVSAERSESDGGQPGQNARLGIAAAGRHRPHRGQPRQDARFRVRAPRGCRSHCRQSGPDARFGQYRAGLRPNARLDAAGRGWPARGSTGRDDAGGDRPPDADVVAPGCRRVESRHVAEGRRSAEDAQGLAAGHQEAGPPLAARSALARQRLRAVGDDRRRRDGRRLFGSAGIDRPHRGGQDAQARHVCAMSTSGRNFSPRRSLPATWTTRTSFRSTTWGPTRAARCSIR